MNPNAASRSVVAALLATILSTCEAHAQYTTIYGGPEEYTAQTTSGGQIVNDRGQMVGIGYILLGEVFSSGRGLLIEPGKRTVELPGVGAPVNGFEIASPNAINASGEAVGESAQFNALMMTEGTRPIRWSSGGEVTALEILGTDPDTHQTSGSAVAINASGQATGYLYDFSSGSFRGQTAVRWDAHGGVQPLRSPWTDGSGYVDSRGNDINDAGQVCGSALVSGLGYPSAVRWEASGQPTALPALGSASEASAINSSGQVAGSATKMDSSGANLGDRPVRWESSGTITELETLGLSPTGVTGGYPFAINESGEMAGHLRKFVAGVDQGTRPVRWDASGRVIELGLLAGTDDGMAFDINADGFTVGIVSSDEYNSASRGWRAVYWRPDGTVVDLNTLIDPLSGWLLTEANSISDTGWIAGRGLFDPDGAGPLAADYRVFLMRVPEPGTAAMLALGGLLVLRRRAARRQAVSGLGERSRGLGSGPG